MKKIRVGENIKYIFQLILTIIVTFWIIHTMGWIIHIAYHNAKVYSYEELFGEIIFKMLRTPVLIVFISVLMKCCFDSDLPKSEEIVNKDAQYIKCLTRKLKGTEK